MRWHGWLALFVLGAIVLIYVVAWAHRDDDPFDHEGDF